MWLAGIFASIASIIYPAISALVSKNSSSEQQGVALGILTGMRGLCNGLGPALFGLFFWLFNVRLEEGEVLVHSGTPGSAPHAINISSHDREVSEILTSMVPLVKSPLIE